MIKKKLYVRHKIVCNEKFLVEVSPIAFSDYIDLTIKFTYHPDQQVTQDSCFLSWSSIDDFR